LSSRKTKGAAAVAPEKQPEVVVPKSKTLVVEFAAPLAEHGKVVLTRVECKLTPRQGRALRLLFDGLSAEGETVRLGTKPEPVVQQYDAVRWILDKIADAASVP